MGGSKLKLSQRKKKTLSQIVSFPLSLDSDSALLSLHSSLTSQSLPESWTVAAMDPLTLVKLVVVSQDSHPRVDATITLAVHHHSAWTLSVLHKQLDPSAHPSLSHLPSTLVSAQSIRALLQVIDSLAFCVGNPDQKFQELWKHRSVTLHGSSRLVTAFLDERSLPITIRHNDCQLLVPIEGRGVARCPPCIKHRKTLTVQEIRMKNSTVSDSSPASHVNLRYQPVLTLVERHRLLKYEHALLQKQLQRLKTRIAEAIESSGITVSEETNEDLCQVMSSPECSNALDQLPEGSFQQLFWQQQTEALKKNPKSMRWHPLMVKFCLYLRHKSGSAYEMLRQSGCLHLPSQRTLRDYTHYIKARMGFSSEVDEMLVSAANLTTCPEREKCVLLLLDEMHIRQDLVFDKHTGEMIGFSNLGDVNQHLVEFEKSLSDDNVAAPKLAKTMMVFMVRGLFSRLEFPYAQFPCADLSGELLYEPFWEAVCRLETCGFKALGATLDGNSVNRRLIKLHDPSSNCVYKVDNPFTDEDEERSFFFFSDPPHLVKTVRNCWFSKARNLYNKGKSISWGHLSQLYERDLRPGVGIRMLPKLKYEHVALTSFSKMRVDLAAQVLSESVSKALKLTGGPEVAETARFVDLMDKFFDALNVSNYTNGMKKRKEFQLPYLSAEDKRLEWLEKDFLPYLENWEKWAHSLPNLTATERNNLLLSAETRLGLKITCKSFIEMVRYLFSVPSVTSFLSQKVCQDPLENFFGCQRQRGGVHDNPNAEEFLKNTQALRVINSFCIAPSQGNCRGASKKRNYGSCHITDTENEPLPKRRKVAK